MPPGVFMVHPSSCHDAFAIHLFLFMWWGAKGQKNKSPLASHRRGDDSPSGCYPSWGHGNLGDYPANLLAGLMIGTPVLKKKKDLRPHRTTHSLSYSTAFKTWQILMHSNYPVGVPANKV